MALDHPLEPGDRIVITVLPDGYIYHVETREGTICAQELKARNFEETISQILADGWVADHQLA